MSASVAGFSNRLEVFNPGLYLNLQVLGPQAINMTLHSVAGLPNKRLKQSHASTCDLCSPHDGDASQELLQLLQSAAPNAASVVSAAAQLIQAGCSHSLLVLLPV